MSTSTDCYLDGDGCLVCPEVQEVVAQPATLTRSVSTGWTAGANSIAALAGDVHAVFDFEPMPLGIVVGFKPAGARIPQDNPNLIQHGIYGYLSQGLPNVDILESGKQRASFAYTPGQSIEIRRVGEKVTYLINGAQVYASSVPSFGAVIVNACLYASGDTLP
jgi:hypothetical protein